ncbi:hypothetical protein PPERSA_07265 [Pseudocohnilembus persalinus]|uniref:Uncharacterized protein n=1 Tax=Pseudocohnilembus persalinus TaxID=266149 RepID=A0A0V0QCZ0_PSEPJ|nr:hypothetical protein PPERSA_07265 [Pseudocohnilembus persalinus]|eukprot:KRX00068.1 hypothetical protein PPERSA_07265 [Pseudocohnilembus persalinus]
MATHLPAINTKTKHISYNYKNLDHSMSANLRRSMPTTSKSMSVNRNIEKYCKTSDIRDILGPNKSVTGSSVDGQVYDLQGEISGNLKMLRKQYDVFRNKVFQKEKDIQKMRHEIEIIKMQQNGFNGNNNFNEQKLQELQEQQEKTQDLLKDAKMNKKTYEYMIERMKNDLISFKLRVHQTQDELDKGKVVLESAKERFQKQKQRYQKIEQAHREISVQKEIESQTRERNVEKFIKEALEKQEVEKQKEERVIRQIEIAEMAANDIRDSNLKKWRKLLLVHQFVSTFMKLKMEREMNQYSKVEKAFQKIKASTGISEAGQIVHKFLNREHTYSHLLISIADYEKKIEDLKKSNENYKHELQKLKEEFSHSEKDSNKNSDQELEALMHKYSQVSEKQQNCQITEERVNEWLKRNILRLTRSVGQGKEMEEQIQNNFSIQEHPEIFEVIRGILEEFLLSQDPKQVQEQIAMYIKQQNQNPNANANSILFQNQQNNNNNLNNEEDFQQQEEFKRKNVRIKTKMGQVDAFNVQYNSNKQENYQTQQILLDQNSEAQELEDPNLNNEENNYLKEQRNLLKYKDNSTSQRKSVLPNKQK